VGSAFKGSAFGITTSVGLLVFCNPYRWTLGDCSLAGKWFPFLRTCFAMGCDAHYAKIGDTKSDHEVQICASEVWGRNPRKLRRFQRKKQWPRGGTRVWSGSAALSVEGGHPGVSWGAQNPGSVLWLSRWHQLWEFPCFKGSGFDTRGNEGVGCGSSAEKPADSSPIREVDMRQSGGDQNRRLANWMLGYSEVVSSALLMVLPAVLGIACDAWLGTTPWCLVAGAVVGLFLGLLRLTKRPGSAAGRVRKQSGTSMFGETGCQDRLARPGVPAGGVRAVEPATGSPSPGGRGSDV